MATICDHSILDSIVFAVVLNQKHFTAQYQLRRYCKCEETSSCVCPFCLHPNGPKVTCTHFDLGICYESKNNKCLLCAKMGFSFIIPSNPDSFYYHFLSHFDYTNILDLKLRTLGVKKGQLLPFIEKVKKIQLQVDTTLEILYNPEIPSLIESNNDIIMQEGDFESKLQQENDVSFNFVQERTDYNFIETISINIPLILHQFEQAFIWVKQCINNEGRLFIDLPEQLPQWKPNQYFESKLE